MPNSFFKKFVRITYAVIGATTLASLIWAIVLLSHQTFYDKMHFFGSVGFFILIIGGLVLGIKSIFNKM